MKIKRATLHVITDEAAYEFTETHHTIELAEDGDASCFIKAKLRDEPTFTIRAQDESAVWLLHRWLDSNPQLSEAKKAQTLVDIERFKAWPHKKKAD